MSDKLKTILRRTPITDWPRPVERELPELWQFVLDVMNRFFSEYPTPPSC